MLKQPEPRASGPVETTFAGYPATRIDLTVPKSFTGKGCGVPGALQLWLYEPDRYTVLFPHTTASVFIFDVHG